MTLRPSALLPLRISSQIAALVVASLLAIHVVLTIGFLLRQDDGRERDDGPALVALVRLVEPREPARRAELVAEAARAFPRMQMRLAPAGSEPAGDPEDPRLRGLRRHLPPGTSAVLVEPGDKGRPERVAVRLSDGSELSASVMPPPGRPIDPLIVSILVLAILITVLGWWAARALTRPLRAFASAAEAFRPDGEIMLLPERGPDEIRSAARALNHMRARVKAMVEERSRMFAAVGHDLRTPITRLRLRSEFIEDEGLRTQALADLDQMRAMVESLLMFMRDGRSTRAPVMVDLTASLTTVCDQFADLGHDVSYTGPDHVAVRGHPDELHRAVTNLVDNAVRYGGCARVRLAATAADVVIDIEDDGPGIPASDRTAMLRPFVRGETARSMDGTTGFGLGLSIAQVVVTAHGGTLALLDGVPRGLLVRIVLPAVAAPVPVTARI
jgi:signal transduction histidine kinase